MTPSLSTDMVSSMILVIPSWLVSSPKDCPPAVELAIVSAERGTDDV